MSAATKLPASLDAERHSRIARLAHIIEDDLTSRGIDVFDFCISESDELWLLDFAIRELRELRWVPWI
jgi:hypothetical protein